MLAGSFSEVTRDDLSSVLVKSAAGLQVSVLLEVLQQTTEFEALMSRKYAMPVSCYSRSEEVRLMNWAV